MKTITNYGTLFRTAQIIGASFVFLIGRRFQKQSSDTTRSWRHMPVYSYDTLMSFIQIFLMGAALWGLS